MQASGWCSRIARFTDATFRQLGSGARVADVQKSLRSIVAIALFFSAGCWHDVCDKSPLYAGYPKSLNPLGYAISTRQRAEVHPSGERATAI